MALMNAKDLYNNSVRFKKIVQEEIFKAEMKKVSDLMLEESSRGRTKTKFQMGMTETRDRIISELENNGYLVTITGTWVNINWNFGGDDN